MVQIAYLLLCHRDPDRVVRQARGLVAGGDVVVIHYDGRAPDADAEEVRAALAGEAGVAFTRQRVRCGWGEWSLVEATIAAARTALDRFPAATHLYLISGDCAPIKSAAYLHAHLEDAQADFIESHDFFESGWIRTGLREERLIYRHFFNERRRKAWFYRSMELQKRLGLKRGLPEDPTIRIGSQWWCLRRSTMERVLALLEARQDLVRFFRTTWIPDETVLQSLVRHLVPEREIRNHAPTFLLFTDYGVPATFYNDQYEFLLAQNNLFARKISQEATELRDRLTDLYASDRTEFDVSDNGHKLHAYLTARGRVGRRFAPRFWEAEANLPRGRELLLIACKKWHIGQRLATRIADTLSLPSQGYVFDDEGSAVPDLGGIESSQEKRLRHRRALVHLLFECLQTERLLLCLDPGRLDILSDLAAAPATVRVLDLRCTWSEAEIADHGRRTGLAGPGTPAETVAALIPMLRRDMAEEGDALAQAGLSHLTRVTEGGDPDRNRLSLATFLSIPEAEAGRLLEGGAPFSDTDDE